MPYLISSRKPRQAICVRIRFCGLTKLANISIFIENDRNRLKILTKESPKTLISFTFAKHKMGYFFVLLVSDMTTLILGTNLRFDFYFIR